jgi:hypothetical protein
MAELDQAKTDMEYNIRKGDYTQAESDALKEATHTAGDFAGDIGTGAARAFAYEEDYAAILAARNPGSEIVRDGAGNLIIEYPDGRAPERINAKGPTATDALQIPGEIAAYTGIGALARRAAPKLASPAIREVTKKTIAQNAALWKAPQQVFSNQVLMWVLVKSQRLVKKGPRNPKLLWM